MWRTEWWNEDVGESESYLRFCLLFLKIGRKFGYTIHFVPNNLILKGSRSDFCDYNICKFYNQIDALTFII